MLKKTNRCEFALFYDQTSVKLRCSTTKELEMYFMSMLVRGGRRDASCGVQGPAHKREQFRC